jgi:hypothetical protein
MEIKNSVEDISFIKKNKKSVFKGPESIFEIRIHQPLLFQC